MRAKFWGVRGSVPTPLTNEQYQEKLFRALRGAGNIDLNDPVSIRTYMAQLAPEIGRVVGGNTTCVEINSGDELIIIDCGSGMRPLGLELMSREFGRGRGMAHIFLTHAHWDHLQGFTFFAPFYVPGNYFTIYAINQDPKTYLQHQQTAPVYFPIPIDMMPATMEFVTLKEGQIIEIGDTRISSKALYHPGVSYAYRFENTTDDGIFVFASDAEYQTLDDEHLQEYLKFYANADALVFDTQYSLRDVFLSKTDWGHSSAMIAVDIAERANVKKIITFHHDHSDTDTRIYEVARAAQLYSQLSPTSGLVDVEVGYEGLELFIGTPMHLEILEDNTQGVWLIALAGYLYADTVAEVSTQIRDSIRRAEDGQVIIDLTLLATLDTNGVLALTRIIRDIPGTKAAFVAPTPSVRRVLENAAANYVGSIFSRRQHAFASLLGTDYLQITDGMIDGRYKLGNVLVADEIGTTFAATDTTNGNSIAAYVLGDETEPHTRDKFIKLAQQWCQLSHAQLVPGHKVIPIDHERIAYISGNPLDAQPWSEWVISHPRLTLITALQTFELMLHALQGAHHNNVPHTQLRPECVAIINNVPHIARVPLFSSGPMPPSTYQSPEQLVGADATLTSDLFSLGVMWYEALVGIHPFSAELEEMVLAQQLSGAPLTLRVFRPDLSQEVEDFFHRILNADPEKRFASVDAVLEAIPELMKSI